MIFLGVDGGGTSTEFLLIDGEGKELSRYKGPTCHYKQTSLENFKDVIQFGIFQVIKEAKLEIKDIDYAFLGIPGYGEIEEDIEKLENIVDKILVKDNFTCGNDSEVGWAGSLACQPGINIVAGTGAIGYGVNCQGEKDRSSGWGHFCGDEGSAYWLGKNLIEVFTKQADGRYEKSQLYNIVRESLNIDNDFELLTIVLDELSMERTKIANLAKYVFMAAEAGDVQAKKIYQAAAYEHYLTIKALIEKLNFKGKILVSYSGGVFKAGAYILDPLKEYLSKLSKDIQLIEPILGPVEGSALYASRIYLKTINPTIVENLKSI